MNSPTGLRVQEEKLTHTEASRHDLSRYEKARDNRPLRPSFFAVLIFVCYIYYMRVAPKCQSFGYMCFIDVKVRLVVFNSKDLISVGVHLLFKDKFYSRSQIKIIHTCVLPPQLRVKCGVHECMYLPLSLFIRKEVMYTFTLPINPIDIKI